MTAKHAHVALRSHQGNRAQAALGACARLSRSIAIIVGMTWLKSSVCSAILQPYRTFSKSYCTLTLKSLQHIKTYRRLPRWNWRLSWPVNRWLFLKWRPVLFFREGGSLFLFSHNRRGFGPYKLNLIMVGQRLLRVGQRFLRFRVCSTWAGSWSWLRPFADLVEERRGLLGLFMLFCLKY